jgi:hypothetical protein
MLAYQALVFVGNDSTGKTTLQRHIISNLCDVDYERLPSNQEWEIVHPRVPKGIEMLSAMNRSYQEKKQTYGSISDFFQNHFAEADICLLSSHSIVADVSVMLEELHRRSYNVTGVFFENCFDGPEMNISGLNWDKRLWLENHILLDETEIAIQLGELGRKVSDWIVQQSANW